MVPVERTPEMTPVRTDAIRKALLTALRDEPRARAARSRKRFAIWGGVGLLVVGGVSAAVAVVLQSQSVSNRGIVHGLASSERGAGGQYIESSATIAAESWAHGDVDDAILLCSEMWKQGVLEEGFDPLRPSSSTGAVPNNLRVCVMGDGSAAVVPGSPNVCAALGLAPAKG